MSWWVIISFAGRIRAIGAWPGSIPNGFTHRQGMAWRVTRQCGGTGHNKLLSRQMDTGVLSAHERYRRIATIGSDDMSRSRPRLVAHRGYAASYPENTLLAIRAAVEAGARYVEFDIQLSSDEIPILFHDRDLQRMCAQTGAVHDYSLQQLKSLSASEFHRFGYKFVTNRLTTLAEAVQYLAAHPAVTAFVEIKRLALQQFGIATVVNKILAAVAPIRAQTVIISYSLEALAQVRQQSDYPIGAVFDNWSEHRQPLIQTLQPEYIFTDIDQLPRTGRLHYPGARLAVYECTDPLKAIKVHQRGIDFVETFAIAEMLQAFELMSDAT